MDPVNNFADDAREVSATKQLFQSYYDNYWDRLVSFSARFVKDKNLAEDIVQEVFQSFWLKLESLNDRESLVSYLYRSTRNRTINAIKRNSQQIFEHALSISDEHPLKETLSDRMTENELRTALHSAIRQLPHRRRVIFKMKVFQRYSNREIAIRLSITVPTVKSQFTKALAFVRSSLAPYL
ncbi:RNA polymerase sigma-70 factor [Fulvivirgaceae bacterium BMA12]|uniref:RNA polymerase sigma-70 factor n=1 Tax=Agaribacillus aureus TaxID=3051825 RepID=A0ABT8L1C5_9BACT|nr:RNA polymerase sigma-70 factor [Fulvivirgaceae bacterium BMA12]